MIHLDKDVNDTTPAHRAARLASNSAALAASYGCELTFHSSDRETVRVEDRAGTQVLLLRRDTGWVSLNSSRRPDAEADSWLDAAGVAADSPVVVVVGDGLGHILRAVQRRAPEARIVIVEPDRAVASVFWEAGDWSAWVVSGRLHLLTGPDYADRSGAWRLFGGVDAPPVVVNPVVRVAIPDEIARVQDVLARLRYAALANARARSDNAARYLLNTLRNSHTIAREADAAALDNLFPGVAAIVISAGPSLDRNIEELRRHRSSAVLIAVDTALRPLLAAGIVPHLAVALDPTLMNAEHLCHLPDPSAVRLVAEGSVHPRALAAFAGRTFIFRVAEHHPWPWLASIGADRVQLEVWGSVATAAFTLARRMQCDPVIFCGQDLAYTDGRAYCAGTTWDTWQTPMPAPSSIPATDVNGHPTLTAPHLASFRDWLVEQSVRSPRPRLINATGAGILHGGQFAPMPLAKAVELGVPLGEAETRQRLRDAHTTEPTLINRLGEARVGIETEVEPMLSWGLFAGPSTPPERITSALDCAATPPGDDGYRDHVQAALMDDLHRNMAGPATDVDAIDQLLAAARREARLGRMSHRRLPARRDLSRLRTLITDLRPKRAVVLTPASTLLVDLVSAAVVEGTVTAAQSAQAGRSTAPYDLVCVEIDDAETLEHTLTAALACVASGGMLAVLDTSDRVTSAAVRMTLRNLAGPGVDLGAELHAEWFSRLFTVRRTAVADNPAPSDASTMRAGDPDALAHLVVRNYAPATALVCGASAKQCAASLSKSGVAAHTMQREELLTRGNIPARYDVIVCADFFEHVRHEDEERAIRYLCAATDVIVFTVPTPGLHRERQINPRAVTHWARRFLGAGFLVTDELRHSLEDRRDFTMRSFDLWLHTARRIPSVGAAAAVQQSVELQSMLSAMAGRNEDLYLQAAMLRLERRDLQAGAPDSTPLQTVPTASVVIPPDDITRGDGHRFRVRFSDTRTRLCLRAGVFAHAMVDEDGVPLPRAQALIGDIGALGRGRYWIGPEHIDLSTSDNSDPRTNGRTYSLRVPAHLARLTTP